jgi:hypothetical protein
LDLHMHTRSCECRDGYSGGFCGTPPSVDCVAEWSPCDENCTYQTYTITTNSSGTGVPCETFDGDQAPCSAGQGDCTGFCEDAYCLDANGLPRNWKRYGEWLQFGESACENSAYNAGNVWHPEVTAECLDQDNNTITIAPTRSSCENFRIGISSCSSGPCYWCTGCCTGTPEECAVVGGALAGYRWIDPAAAQCTDANGTPLPGLATQSACESATLPLGYTWVPDTCGDHGTGVRDRPGLQQL